jgi:hypothetical protein
MSNRELIDEITESLDKLSMVVSTLPKTEVESKKYLSDEDVAILLGVSIRTVRHYRQKRLIEYVKIGGQIYYTDDAITKMMDAHKIPSNNG